MTGRILAELSPRVIELRLDSITAKMDVSNLKKTRGSVLRSDEREHSRRDTGFARNLLLLSHPYNDMNNCDIYVELSVEINNFITPNYTRNVVL